MERGERFLVIGRNNRINIANQIMKEKAMKKIILGVAVLAMVGIAGCRECPVGD